MNKAVAQVSELFRSMTPGARIVAGLLLATVVVSVGYLFNHQVSGGDAFLLDGQHFSTAELQAMQAAFGKAGLGSFEIEGGRVRVPRGLKAKYMAALADEAALPAHFGSYLDAALNKPSPFTSKEQQQAMLKTALQKELATVIRQMKGVENAQVFYNIEKRRGLTSESTITASVSVQPVGTTMLSSDQVPKIRDLVAGAIGATPNQVTVVDVNGLTYKAGGKDDVPGILDDPYAQRVKYWKDYFEHQIHQALEYVPGVVVTAYVELDPRTRNEEERTKVDPKTVPITVKEETETNQTDAAAPSGQPGLQAQRPNTAATLPAQTRGNHTEKERSTLTQQNDASRDYTRTVTAPLTPRRVSVAVSVPSGYFEKVYREQAPSAAGQPPQPIDPKKMDQVQKDETDRIKALIANIIPQSDSTADTLPSVTVATFRQIPADAIPTVGAGSVVLDWFLANWSTAGMAGLALVSLVMLRSMVRSAPLQTAIPELPLPPATAPPPEQEVTKEATEPTEKRAGRLKRRLGSGQSLRDELAEMVREDPDTAASILRGWIGTMS